jgi:NAD(P)-dependent dehydrogenase (short-subunit alcohol dehydrogenase family)
MDTALSGQVALVTGSASGIGRATALMLAAAGAHIALVDRDAAGLAAVASEIGPKARTFEADLGQGGSLPGLVSSVLAAFGRIDILVNCAGITGISFTEPQSSIDFTDAQLDAVLGVNLRAPFILTREVGKHMVARGGGGRIVNVSSSAAFRATASPPIYAASKAGLNALTRTAAADLGPHGVNVNAVAPGATRTSMLADVDQYLEEMVKSGPLANLTQKVSEAEDVAAVIRFLCLPDSRQMTGQVLHTSGGLVV